MKKLDSFFWKLSFKYLTFNNLCAKPPNRRFVIELADFKKENWLMPFLSKLIFVLFVFGVNNTTAQTNTLSDTNFVSAHDADSIISAIELNLDKSGYGFYNIVCNDGYTLNYRLMIPVAAPGMKYPLVFTLPASGSAGSNNTTQMGGVGPSIWGQPQYQSIHPHYSVVPQQSLLIPDTPSTNYKNICAFEFKELRDTLIQLYPNIDTNRIYLTGHSAGGSFVYRMLGIFPNSFAAGVPADGAIGGIHEGYGAMAVWPAVYVANNTPVWMFNGGFNDVVLPDQINGMFNIADSIILHGGDPITSYMPNLNHAETEGMYKLETELFEWLFAQHKDANIINIGDYNQLIKIFPNPASDIIFISGIQDKLNSISIYSVLGIKVFEKDISGKIIDISSLSDGIYILKVNNRVVKFMKS